MTAPMPAHFPSAVIASFRLAKAAMMAMKSIPMHAPMPATLHIPYPVPTPFLPTNLVNVSLSTDSLAGNSGTSFLETEHIYSLSVALQ